MKALIIVDLQNDFCANGVLEIEHADEVIAIANQLMASRYFDLIIATQDWHPANHKSFAANHVFRYPGQIVEINGINQRLWPMHCVQESFGADFSSEFESDKVDKIVQKGTNPEMDAYSAFYDNEKRQQTDLADLLKEKSVQQVFVMGLATEYSVKETALDANNLGFETFLIEDACRAANWDENDGQKAIHEIQECGVTLLDADQLIL